MIQKYTRYQIRTDFEGKLMLPSGTKYGSTEVLPEIDTSVRRQIDTKVVCTEVRKYFRKYSISGSNNLSIPYESTKVLRTTFVSTKVCTKVLPYEVIYFRTPHVTSGSTCIVHVRVHVYVCTFEGIKFFEGERALYTRPRTLVSVTRAPSSMK